MTLRTGVAKKSGLRFGFVRGVIGELRKVVWLTRREAVYLTGLVIIVAGIAGIILGALDYGFTRLIDGIFLVK